MLPTKFKSIYLSGSGKEAKNRFSRWRPWRLSWISDPNDFNYFYIQVNPMLSIMFQANWPYGSGEEAKNRFSRFPIEMILAIFDLQTSPMLPTKFQVNWHFCSGKEVKTAFQDGGHGGHFFFFFFFFFGLWRFLLYLSSSHPDKTLLSFE